MRVCCASGGAEGMLHGRAGRTQTIRASPLLSFKTYDVNFKFLSTAHQGACSYQRMCLAMSMATRHGAHGMALMARPHGRHAMGAMPWALWLCPTEVAAGTHAASCTIQFLSLPAFACRRQSGPGWTGFVGNWSRGSSLADPGESLGIVMRSTRWEGKRGRRGPGRVFVCGGGRSARRRSRRRKLGCSKSCSMPPVLHHQHVG